MTLRKTVSRLITSVEHLDRDFNFYFTGREKLPPLKNLEKLKREVNMLMKSAEGSKNSAEKYLVLSFVQKFTTYRTKWERGVRDIEEGRLAPGRNFFGGLGNIARDFGDLSQHEKDNNAFRTASVIDEAAAKYVEMNRKHSGKNVSKEAVSKMLEKRIDEIRKKVGDKFRFKVFVEDGKVKIKPEKE
jgi:hypothetical protein